MAFIIDGKTYSGIHKIEDPMTRNHFQTRIESHKAFSYHGDWYSSLKDLSVEQQKEYEEAEEKLKAGVDVRSIPKVEVRFLWMFGNKAVRNRFLCALSSIGQDGKIDCAAASRQYNEIEAGFGPSDVQPLSFLRRLNEIAANANDAARESLKANVNAPAVPLPGHPASVKWNGKELKEKPHNGTDGDEKEYYDDECLY